MESSNIDVPMHEDTVHPLLNDQKVFLVKIPSQIYQRLFKDVTTNKQEEEIGELRVDEDGNCLMLMRDLDGRRVSLKTTGRILSDDNQHGEFGTNAVITESLMSGEMKLRQLVSEKLVCLPRNYKVGEDARTGFFR